MAESLHHIRNIVKTTIKETERVKSAYNYILRERQMWIFVLYTSGWKKTDLAKLTGYTRQRISQIVLQFERRKHE